ncbi:MAG: energy transducer TonB [Candidatus Rifleibacteriota bacterium]
MKILKFLKHREIEGADELKLSLMLHLALLLALSAFFVWRQASAQPLKKEVVPVKLISPVAKPRIGSGPKAEKKEGARTAEGKTKKLVKKTEKKPVAKTVAKKETKPAAKPVEKKQTAVAKEETKEPVSENTNKTPIQSETAVTKTDPAVVQEVKKEILPIKPVHNTPTFDAVSHIAPGESASTEIDPEFAGLEMSNPSESLMPDSFLEDEREVSMPEDYVPAPTGIEKPENNEGSGLFEIGSIESFGGNGDNFSAPGIVQKVLPEYPAWARKSGVHGNAVYRVLIQPSGTVGDVVTMSSTIDPKLAINGAQALRRWVFTPVLRNGEPQETWVKITVQYQLN